MKHPYRVIFLSLGLLLTAAFISCGKGAAYESSAVMDAGFGGGRTLSKQAVPAPVPAETGGENHSSIIQETQTGQGREHLLVKRANLRTRVEDLEKAEEELNRLIEQFRGYAAMRSVYENSRNYTLRIPSVSYGPFLAALDTMGRPLYRAESAEDVTLQYYDLESRLNTKRDLLDTFRSYLRRADSIEDILAVEARIAELQQEIDWMGTQLKGLADLVDYSTIELELLGPASTASYSRPTLGDRIGGLFRSFGGFLGSVLVVLVGIIVYGIPCLLLLALLYWLLLGRVGLLRKLWRLVKEKKDENRRPVKKDAEN